MNVAPRTPLLLRKRRPEDDPFIAELAARAFAEYDPDAPVTTLRMARAGSTWLVSRDNRPLGFAVLRRAGPGAAELCAIAVEEQARGAGVGTALLAQVERALADEGGAELSVHTALSNLSALELFLKHGFRVVRRLPRFYRGMFEACALSKRVHAAARWFRVAPNARCPFGVSQ